MPPPESRTRPPQPSSVSGAVSWLCTRLLVTLLLTVVFFSPFPHGSVEPWYRNFFQLLVFLGFAVWALRAFISPQDARVSGGSRTVGSSRLAFVLLAAFFVLCLLQLLPMPSWLLVLFSAEGLDIWRTNALVLEGLGLGAGTGFFTISLNPGATWASTLTVASYAAFGFLTARLVTSRGTLQLVLLAVFLLALIEALLGITQYLVNLGIEGVAPLAKGTFYNKNHFAGFLEMTIPLVLGYAVSLGEWGSARVRGLKALVSSESLPRQILLVLLLGLMLLALMLSKSRSGLVSIAVALVFYWIASRAKSAGGGGWLVLLFIFFAISFGLWVGLYPVYENFLSVEGDAAGRLLVWKDTLGLIGDFPLFGSGLGTFKWVFPLYKDSMELPVVYNYAHNDYLQLMAETGIIGFALLMGALASALLLAFRRILAFDAEPGSLRLNVALGCLAGIVSILLHSFADFNLHIPANGLMFAFLMGLLFASISTRGQQQAPRSKPRRRTRRALATPVDNPRKDANNSA